MSPFEFLQRFTLTRQNGENLERQPLSKLFLDALPLVTGLDDPFPGLPSPLLGGEGLGRLKNLCSLPASDDPDARAGEFDGLAQEGDGWRSRGELQLGEHVVEVGVGSCEFAIPHDETGEDREELSVGVEGSGVCRFCL